MLTKHGHTLGTHQIIVDLLGTLHILGNGLGQLLVYHQSQVRILFLARFKSISRLEERSTHYECIHGLNISARTSLVFDAVNNAARSLRPESIPRVDCCDLLLRALVLLVSAHDLWRATSNDTIRSGLVFLIGRTLLAAS